MTPCQRVVSTGLLTLGRHQHAAAGTSRLHFLIRAELSGMILPARNNATVRSLPLIHTACASA